MMAYIRLNLREMMAFRLNFTMVFFKMITGIVQFFLFWFILGGLSFDSTFNGWSFKEMGLIIAFSHLSLSVFQILSLGFYFLPYLVVHGSLDSILILPENPTKALIGRVLSPERLLTPIVSLIAVGIAYYLNPRLNPLLFLLGVILAIAGSVLENLVAMVFNLLSFWIGTMQAIVQVLNNFGVAKRFPLDGLGGATGFLLTFIVPLFFVATFPASIILQRVSVDMVMWGVAALGTLLTIWFSLFRKLWQSGLKNYQSGGSL